MNPLEAQTYLNSFINHEHSLNSKSFKSFKLDRVKYLLNEIGNPQNGLSIVHVAGSKGKGSTCAITASILKEAGYRVGLYTSPHIYDLKERIRVLNKNKTKGNDGDVFTDSITDDELCKVLEDIKPSIEKIQAESSFGSLSFYEVFTALALYYFMKENVDLVVLETGLGGRLDATNVVSSLIAAITPISLEHTDILGNQLDLIAAEKAAIIKETNQQVVYAPQEKSVEHVIENRCREFHIKPLNIDKDFKIDLLSQNLESQKFHVSTNRNNYENLNCPLLGRHQAFNCAVAIGIIEKLMDATFKISDKNIIDGVKNVYWPTRFEIIRSNSLMVLDSAHCRASAKELVNTIKSVFPDKKVTLVFGVSNDKNIDQISQELRGIVNNLITTKANHPRSDDLSDQDILRLFPGIKYEKTTTVREAMEITKKQNNKKDIVVVTGSSFLTSEARKLCIS